MRPLFALLALLPLASASHVPAPDVEPRQPTFGDYWETYTLQDGQLTVEAGHREEGAHALHLRRQADRNDDGNIDEGENAAVQQVLADASGVKQLVTQQRRISINGQPVRDLERSAFTLMGFVGATERTDELRWTDTWNGTYPAGDMVLIVSGKSPQTHRNLTITVQAPGHVVQEATGLPTHEDATGLAQVAWTDSAGTWYAGPPWQAIIRFQPSSSQDAPGLEVTFMLTLILGAWAHARPRRRS